MDVAAKDDFRYRNLPWGHAFSILYQQIMYNCVHQPPLTYITCTSSFLFIVTFAQTMRNAHGTEVWTAHGAELSVFEMCVFVILCSQVWIKTQVELVLPSEFVARF